MAKKANSKDKKKTKKEKNIQSERSLKKKREIQALLIIALGLFVAIAMFFGITGVVGEAIESFFKGCFGLISYLLPFYLLIYGACMLVGRTKVLKPLATIFFILLFLAFSMANSVRFIGAQELAASFIDLKDTYASGIKLESGGVVGMFLASLLVKTIGKAGAYLTAAVVALISVIIISDKPYAEMANWEEMSEERKAKRKAKAEEKKRLEEERVRLEQQKTMELPEVQEKHEEPKLPDYKKTRKAIKKARLAENQKNILGLMTDDSLSFGQGEGGYEGGYGLDGSQESLSQPDKGLNEGYDKGDMGREEYQGYTGGYTNFAEKETESTWTPVIEKKAPEVVKETKIVSKDPVKNEEKISNAEAKKATLDKNEFNTEKSLAAYRLPPVDLLRKVEIKGADLTELARKTSLLEETMKSFNVDARVVDAVPGPTVTRYEIEPSAGVKVSKIVGLKDDIALKLQAKNIRIEAPIPGKAAVGIEVENDTSNMVTIREIIESPEFKRASSKISFSVGKDITGRAIVGDLKSMPHLLIAGSTGSGKSVCINSIIASILYKAKPEEVKLVLIDPKVVELGNYNGIPHLLIPVVTKPEKAAASLNWAVAEMNERYRKFAETGVRDLASFNEHAKANGDEDQVMPQIVIIIDELADLMMAAPSQVEESICRLAQMARAAGMHLIVATQRPSVDVITGVIKANIPSRIAFAVSSQFDSRTILDMSGAEKLIGKGDMLYSPLGMGKPVRVQGCFISDDEVNSIIAYVKSQVEEVSYADDVISTIDRTDSPAAVDDAGDELLPDCIEFVVQAGQASVSMLQRRFRIGYNRAARIMDMMEERQIVGPQDGSRPRQVLMTEEELNGPSEEIAEESENETEEKE